MKPELFGHTSYFVLWVVGAIVGVWTATRAARHAGFPGGRSLCAACALALAIVLGSKLLFLFEHALLPADATLVWEQGDLRHVLRFGFRIPGGIVLMALVLPLLCRRLRLAALPFADAILPGVGIALFFIRVGCLLNGCCFGAVTASPLAITFPAGAQVYGWQLASGLIAPGATRTLPVHPLQAYFALMGLALFVLSRHWQRTKRLDGQVWFNFNLVFFGASFFLELLRPQPLRLNLALCAAVLMITVVLRSWRRQPVVALGALSPTPSTTLRASPERVGGTGLSQGAREGVS
jgi:phosphatidylglycerol:prolipoprotein diacylglycerol transferase